MSKLGRETTVARFRLARENAEWVLAEAALKGERMVAWVRVALVALLVLSQRVVSLLSGEVLPRDRLRLILALLYILFALAALRSVHRQQPDPQVARWRPLFITLIDTAFFFFMSWRASMLLGYFNAPMPAATFAVVLCFSVARYGRLHVVVSTAAACLGFVAASVLSKGFSWSVSSFVVGCYVALGILIGKTNASVNGMFLGLRRRDNLSRFLPKQVVRRVLEQGDSALAPVQREVTILFSDIRDFTTLSERLEPRQVLELLDEYFEHMSAIVKERGGMVNKFLGDGMLACWGVPDSSETHAADAMRAALDMRAKLAELNAWREGQGLPPLKIGIGLHTGVVAAGMLGGAEQAEYTVIGDAVNLASRVEGLTKALGVDILVSESTWRQGQGRFAGRRVSEEKVKGRQEAVVVYALEGTLPAGGARQGPVAVGAAG